jgi:hypothetical protein
VRPAPGLVLRSTTQPAGWAKARQRGLPQA